MIRQAVVITEAGQKVDAKVFQRPKAAVSGTIRRRLKRDLANNNNITQLVRLQDKQAVSEAVPNGNVKDHRRQDETKCGLIYLCMTAVVLFSMVELVTVYHMKAFGRHLFCILIELSNSIPFLRHALSFASGSSFWHDIGIAAQLLCIDCIVAELNVCFFAIEGDVSMCSNSNARILSELSALSRHAFSEAT